MWISCVQRHERPQCQVWDIFGGLLVSLPFVRIGGLKALVIGTCHIEENALEKWEHPDIAASQLIIER